MEKPDVSPAVKDAANALLSLWRAEQRQDATQEQIRLWEWQIRNALGKGF